jgi:hypothetical protein
MALKIKAKIYQYFGIFLAHKEQGEYLDKLLRERDKKRLNYNSLMLTVSMWQATNGFLTFSTLYEDRLLRFKKNKLAYYFNRLICRLIVIYKQAKFDLKQLRRKV